MLKIGIIGMGGMGWFHARRYLQLADARLVAIADLVPERLEARDVVQINIADETSDFDFSQVARYSDAGALIANADVDVVDICLPTYLHAQYTVAALEAGFHVLCEKPMALNVAEADRMLAAGQATGRFLMIAHCLRFWPEYQFLRDRVQDGRYGPLRSLNMWRFGGRPSWSARNWFLDPALSGGMMLDLHIHDVDYVNALFGAPERIWGTARAFAASQSPDVIHAIFTYPDGPQIHMHAGWSAAQVPFQAGFEAWFERAFVVYNEGTLEVFDSLEKVQKKVPDYEPGDAYLNEITYFLRCVEEASPPLACMPASTRESVALIQQELDKIG